MTGRDLLISTACNELSRAGVGQTSWNAALQAVADATGSKSGQLIGIAPGGGLPFHVLTNVPDALSEDFAAMGGEKPQNNPRVKAGFNLPILQSAAESDYVSYDNINQSPIYAGLYSNYDVPFSCLSNILRSGELTVGLAVLRSLKEGHISTDERRAFDLLAPHVRRAVLGQMAFGTHGPAVMARTLESLSVAAFVCDGAGAVRAMTTPAQAIVNQGHPLQLQSARLRAWRSQETHALALAIHLAAFSDPLRGAPQTIKISRRDHPAPLLLEVLPVPPSAHDFTFDVQCIVVVRTSNIVSHSASAAALFDLTPAESIVVDGLLRGMTPKEIALLAGVSIGTTRTHMRHIFEKAQVSGQTQLLSLIMALGDRGPPVGSLRHC